MTQYIHLRQKSGYFKDNILKVKLNICNLLHAGWQQGSENIFLKRKKGREEGGGRKKGEWKGKEERK